MRILSWPVSQVSQSINDQLVIGCSSEFPFEQRPNLCPHLLCCREFQMSDRRREPIFCLATEAEQEIGESGGDVSVVRYLTFIDARDEFLSIDSVLAFLTKKFGNFNHFLFEGNICVCQNLLCQLCCSVLSSQIDDDILLLNDATGSRSANWWVRHGELMIVDPLRVA